MMYFELLVVFYLSFIGACLGSFTTMLVYRLHHEIPGVLAGRSQCPNCQKSLYWYQLIPIVSWFLQGGKCGHCQKPVSIRYPLIELTFALVFAIFTQHFYGAIELPMILITVFFFLVLFFYDLLYLEVDDRLAQPFIVIIFLNLLLTLGSELEQIVGGGVIFIWLLFFIFRLRIPVTAASEKKYDQWFTIFLCVVFLLATFSEAGLREFLIGGIVGFGFYALQYYASGKTWVGAGDMRLGLILGLVLGWKVLLLCLFLAYIIGSLVAIVLLILGKAGRKTALPMGAFLMPAGLVCLYAGPELWDWYWGGIF